MSDLFTLCPRPPSWSLDWNALDAGFPWIRALQGCPQDPIHHAEGNVWIHTRMVCEALAALPAWRALPEEDRQVIFAATVLHDVAKPECTRTEPTGRISARGHSLRGSIRARNLLWESGVGFPTRERVAGLVRYHQVPYFLLDRLDPQRLAFEVSLTARADHLALMAEADVRGRQSADTNRLLDNIALFVDYCQERDCLTQAWSFPSDHTRFLYFRDPTRLPDQAAHEDFGSKAILMSGLPGAGKDQWIRHHIPTLPMVSLDAIRADLAVAPGEDQGRVLNRAREMARGYLREGTSFVWNATNVARSFRSGLIDLFASYKARTHIVYVETSAVYQTAQNRGRAAPVPEKVIARMRDRWEVPDLTEAHEVSWVVRE